MCDTDVTRHVQVAIVTCGCRPAGHQQLTSRYTLQELFGPLSMRALEDDQYCRQTAGYLPEASVAFIDEVFKANSSILNTLLTIMNERLFDNGSKRLPIPLMCLVSFPDLRIHCKLMALQLAFEEHIVAWHITQSLQEGRQLPITSR